MTNKRLFCDKGRKVFVQFYFILKDNLIFVFNII